MSLISCTECGKQFSDRANSCPNCGCPTLIIQEAREELLRASTPDDMKKSTLNFEKVLYQLVLYKYNLEKTNEKVTTQVKNINEINNDVKCPRCGSTQIAAKKKGFGLGKAVVGGLLLGPFGLLGGAIGSNKTIVVCIKCGREWTV